MTWGIEGNVVERFASAGVPGDRISFVRDTYTFDFPGPAGRVRAAVPELLRADHERLRGGREERPGRRAATGAGDAVHGAEQGAEPGVDLHPRDLPARHRRTLTPKETDMTRFALPRDLSFNTEKVADPSALAQERRAASWLYLNGEEFAAMEGGISYAQVQHAVPTSINVISDSAEGPRPRAGAAARGRSRRAPPPHPGDVPLRSPRVGRRVHVLGPAGRRGSRRGARRGRAEQRAVLQVRRLQAVGSPVDRDAPARRSLPQSSGAWRQLLHGPLVPSGSRKKTKEPQLKTWTSLTSTPRRSNSVRAA